MWILILTIMTGSSNNNTSSVTAEFTTKDRCETAVSVYTSKVSKNYGVLNSKPDFAYICVQK